MIIDYEPGYECLRLNWSLNATDRRLIGKGSMANKYIGLKFDTDISEIDFKNLCSILNQEDYGDMLYIDISWEIDSSETKIIEYDGCKFRALCKREPDINRWVEFGQREIFSELKLFAKALKKATDIDGVISSPFITGTPSYKAWQSFIKDKRSSSSATWNNRILFQNDEYLPEYYATSKLEYVPTEGGEASAYNMFIENQLEFDSIPKFEWIMGSLFSNCIKDNEFMVVAKGEKKTGKTTLLNFVKECLGDLKEKSESTYSMPVDLKEITSGGSSHATEVFLKHKLFMYTDDIDLRRMKNIDQLNMLCTKSTMSVNPKGRPHTEIQFDGLLWVNTNYETGFDPSDGIGRRILEIKFKANRLEPQLFKKVRSDMSKEIPIVVNKWIKTYKEMGVDAFSNMKVSEETMRYGSPIYRYMTDCSRIERYSKINDYTPDQQDNWINGTTAYTDYKQWCEDEGSTPVPGLFFYEEMKSYFSEYHGRGIRMPSGQQWNHAYGGTFNPDINFNSRVTVLDMTLEDYNEYRMNNLPDWLKLNHFGYSPLEKMWADCPAQYGTADHPTIPWCCEDKLRTLSDLDTSRVHWVNPTDGYWEHHIIIDLDIKKDGNKCRELNLKRAATFPPTYAEFSKSGAGVHLHYLYDGDVLELAPIIEEDVEIKVYSGKQSLRRKNAGHNAHEIATIPVGYLPKKSAEEIARAKARQADLDIKDEGHLRNLIKKAISGDTNMVSHNQNTRWICTLLETAWNTPDLEFNMEPYKDDIYAYAAESSHHAGQLKILLDGCHFMSQNYKTLSLATVPHPVMDINDDTAPIEMVKNDSSVDVGNKAPSKKKPPIFFDLEVYRNTNLLVYCVMLPENDPEEYMRNMQVVWDPDPDLCRKLLRSKRLIGYNNRAYDNHIMYAKSIGMSPEEVYDVSQGIITNQPKAQWPHAWNSCDLDLYNLSKKAGKAQSLKKWELELDIPHEEMEWDWNEPLPDELREIVEHYCINDVFATTQVYYALTDYVNTQYILADITGLDSARATNKMTEALIFGNDPNPQLVYTDLSEEFPGYHFEVCKSKEEHKAYLAKLSDEGVDMSQLTTWDKDDDETGYKIVSTYMGVGVGEGGYVWSNPGYYENVVTFDVASMHPHSILALNMFGDYTKNFKDLLDARLDIKHKDFESAKKRFGGALAPYLENSDPDILAKALKVVINSVYGLTSARKQKTRFLDERNIDNICAKRGSLFMVGLLKECQARGIEVAHVKTDSIKLVNPSEEAKEFVLNYGKQYGYTFEVEDVFDRICLIDRAQYIAFGEGHWHAKGAQFLNPVVFKGLFTGEELTLDDRAIIKESKKGPIYMVDSSGNAKFVGKCIKVVCVTNGYDCMKMQEGEDKLSYVTGCKDHKWIEYSAIKELPWEEWYIDESYYEDILKETINIIEQFVPFSTLKGND